MLLRWESITTFHRIFSLSVPSLPPHAATVGIKNIFSPHHLAPSPPFHPTFSVRTDMEKGLEHDCP